MESIDPKEHRKVDRRTFLKGGLVAGGVLAAGLGDQGARRQGRSRPRKPARPTRPAAASRRGAAGSGAKPNILVIVVDQMRFPQWSRPSPVGPALPANLAATALGRGVLRAPLHGLQRLHPGTLDAADGPVHPPDGLHDHRREHARPGVPDLGDDAARARLLDALARQVAPDPPRQPLDPTQRRSRRSSATGSPAACTPRRTARPDRAGAWTRTSPRRFADWFGPRAAPGRGARPCRSSTRTTSPGGTRWSDASPPRPTRRPRVRAAAELRDARAADRAPKPRLQRSFQDTAAASFGPVPFSGPEVRSAMARIPGPLRQAPARGRPAHRSRAARRSKAEPEVAANTVIVFTSDHGEYGASHGLRGKGASGYEEGIRVPLIVKDPRGMLTRRPSAAHAADLERGRRAAAADDRDRLERLAQRPPLRAHRRPARPRARSSPTRTRPGGRYVLHATDEIVTEFAIEPYAADAPLHVVAMRTRAGQVRHLLALGRRRRHAAERRARKPSCMTTERQAGGWSCTTAPGAARWRRACARECGRRSPGAARPAAVDGSTERTPRGFADYFSTAKGRRDQRRGRGANGAQNARVRGRRTARVAPAGLRRTAPRAGASTAGARLPRTAPAASSACTAR